MPSVRSGIDPVTALVLFLLGIVPGVLYLLFAGGQRSASCPGCGSPELVPIDSARGRELLGPSLEEVALAGRRLAVAAESARQVEAARAHRSGMIGLAVVGAAVVALVAVFGWLLMREAPEDPGVGVGVGIQRTSPATAVPAPAPEVQAALDMARGIQRDAPRTMTIRTDGLALASPRANADPVMRVTKGETWQVGEERDSYIRIADAPGGVEAWIAVGDVTR